MRRKSVFTAFKKAVDDHIGLSFGRSAADNCDPVCRLWDSCYAARIERIYRGLNRKLTRHQRRGPTSVVNQAIVELEKRPQTRFRWARLSIDGSLPSRQDVPQRSWSGLVRALRQFCQLGLDRGAKWHIPVESAGKARTYRAILGDLGVVVRRTSQARTWRELARQTDHRSWVVAERIHGGCINNLEKARNTAMAYQIATKLRQHDLPTVVCPAITSDSKCGKCTACADPRVDIVLYPFHA